MPRTRSPRHRGRLAIAGLLIATLAAGVWFFALRDQATVQDEFETAATRYDDAGQQMMAAVDRAHTFIDLDNVATVVTKSSTTMTDQVTILQRLATSNRGQRAQIAQTAVTSAQNGVVAGGAFYAAVVANKITSADDARAKLTAALTELQQAVKSWKQS
jgi:hypothetical protein